MSRCHIITQSILLTRYTKCLITPSFLIRFTSFFRSDATLNNLLSLKKLGVQHVQREQYRCFNIEWAWSKIFEFSNFGDGILDQVGTVSHYICKATTLKYKTRRWYKTQRMGTDFCPPPPPPHPPPLYKVWWR